MRLINSVAFWTVMQLSAVLLYCLSFIVNAISAARGLYYSFVRYLCRLLFAMFFIKIKVGGEPIPAAGKVLYVANHPGLLDQLYLIAYFPRRLHFVADEGMLKIALLGRIIRAVGSVSYPRKKEEAFRLAGELYRLLEAGEAPLILADRSINLESVVKLAAARDAMIVPLKIAGSEKVLPKNSLLISPGQVDIIIQRPIASEDIRDAKTAVATLRSYFS